MQQVMKFSSVVSMVNGEFISHKHVIPPEEMVRGKDLFDLL